MTIGNKYSIQIIAVKQECPEADEQEIIEALDVMKTNL